MEDTNFFSLLEGDQNLRNLLSVLEFFSTVSGLKINRGKCSTTGINTHARKVSELELAFGCEVDKWPMKYLVLPVQVNPMAISLRDPMGKKLEKM